MTDEDFGNTTAVIVRKVRKHLTPTTVWGAITVLAVAIGYVVNAEHDIFAPQGDGRQA